MIANFDIKDTRKFKTVTFGCLIFAPLVYFVIPIFVETAKRPQAGEFDLLFYILTITAVIEPSLWFVIEKFQIDQYNKSTTRMKPNEFYFSISIIKYSLVLSVYIFGLIIYFMSGDVLRFYFFYPIGILWTFIFWPRENNYIKFLEKLRKDEFTAR